MNATAPVHLDHVTINTSDLAATLAFYGELFGLASGPRPDFGFAGAWLYPPETSYPIIHIIVCDDMPASTAAAPVDHIAFRCSGLEAHLQRLRDRGDWFRAAPVHPVDPDPPLRPQRHQG